MRHTYPGVLAGPLRDNHDSLEAFISSQTGTQANRWQGNNRGGYSNPVFDRLYDQSIVALREKMVRSTPSPSSSRLASWTKKPAAWATART
jgi:hypothetical protein